MNNKVNPDHCRRENMPSRRGTSYWLQDAGNVFAALALASGNWFLDAGCGPGDYTLHASRIVGESGRVFALDRNEMLIQSLVAKANELGLGNIKAITADLTERLPLDDACIDICLLSTVLHIPGVVEKTDELCSEICRVLKPAGRLAVIECHSKDLSFGPPEKMRLSPDQVRNLMAKYGFTAIDEMDLGFNYLIQFSIA